MGEHGCPFAFLAPRVSLAFIVLALPVGWPWTLPIGLCSEYSPIFQLLPIGCGRFVLLPVKPILFATEAPKFPSSLVSGLVPCTYPLFAGHAFPRDREMPSVPRQRRTSTPTLSSPPRHLRPAPQGALPLCSAFTSGIQSPPGTTKATVLGPTMRHIVSLPRSISPSCERASVRLLMMCL